ncbi:MAG: hypothetical protein V2B17_04975 [Chloroflexota bacterium]
MLILKGLLRWGASILLGLLAVAVVGVLRLDVLPALVLAFAVGCVAAYVATPGATKLADIFSLTWLGAGVGAGAFVALFALGVPIEFFAGGWFVWLLGAVLAGWLVVSVPRTAEENSFFGRIRRRWRGRS